MLEAQNMQSKFEAPKEVRKNIFQEFVKFLYFDDI